MCARTRNLLKELSERSCSNQSSPFDTQAIRLIRPDRRAATQLDTAGSPGLLMRGASVAVSRQNVSRNPLNWKIMKPEV